MLPLNHPIPQGIKRKSKGSQSTSELPLSLDNTIPEGAFCISQNSTDQTLPLITQDFQSHDDDVEFIGEEKRMIVHSDSDKYGTPEEDNNNFLDSASDDDNNDDDDDNYYLIHHSSDSDNSYYSDNSDESKDLDEANKLTDLGKQVSSKIFIESWKLAKKGNKKTSSKIADALKISRATIEEKMNRMFLKQIKDSEEKNLEGMEKAKHFTGSLNDITNEGIKDDQTRDGPINKVIKIHERRVWVWGVIFAKALDFWTSSYI